MRLVIKDYSTDGSSLSRGRCSQIIKVFKLCESFGSSFVTYRGIQEEAESQKIFGSTNAKSAIRTIFPLLKKIGFVNYPEDRKFEANSFFTNLGKAFVNVLIALEITEQISNKDVVSLIDKARQNILLKGIENLSKSEYCNHGILLAIEILRQERVIHWDEFLFFLHGKQTGVSLSDAIKTAKSNRLKNETYDYVNSDGDPIKSTSYTYVRSFLYEAGVIPDSKGMISKLNFNKLEFLESLPPYEYYS